MVTFSLKPIDESKYRYSAKNYFNANYEEEWFDDPIVREMVKDVDQSTVVSGRLIDSEFLGPIPPCSLSGGVKGLILILKDPDIREFSSTIFGENCVPWIAKLSYKVDFTIVLNHALELIGDTPINAQWVDGTPLHTLREALGCYIRNF